MQDMSGIVDVAIGLVFVYLLLSLICSSLTEMAEAVLFKCRGKKLCQGLFELFGGDNGSQKSFEFLKAFYKNPLIYGLYQNNVDISKKEPKENAQDTKTRLKLSGKPPSYIAPKTFAMAFVTQILDGHPLSTATLARQIDNTALLPPDLKKSLKVLIESAGGDLNAAIKNIEDWYSDMGDRLTGWYKRHTQGVALVIAFLITVMGNVDTITIAKSLMVDDSLRKEMVSAAEQYAKIGAKTSPMLVKKQEAATALKDDIANLSKDGTKAEQVKNKRAELELLNAEIADIKQDFCKAQALSPKQCYDAQIKQMAALSSFGLPIGWQSDDRRIQFSCANWLEKLFGWLITALAISLGAPFWFDILNKFMTFRSTIRPPEPAGKTANGKTSGTG